MSKDKLLSQLRKIIESRDSAAAVGNMAEAENYAATLNRLLLDHKLSMSEVQLSEIEEDDPFGKDYIRPNGKHGRQRISWIEQLAMHIARANFCRILVNQGSNRITLFGRESDRQVAAYTISYLTQAVERESKRQYGQRKRSGLDTWGFTSEFKTAATAAIQARLKAERTAATEEIGEQSTALVVLHDAALKKAYLQTFRHTSSATRIGASSQWNDAGRDAGRAYGASVNINSRGIAAGERKAIR
jgi:hypothetical protein